METGVLIALLLGGAQVLGSILVLISTIISNKDERLKNTVEKQEAKIEKFARQIYFLRFVEESVYYELAQANADRPFIALKRDIHQAIASEISIPYESLDGEVKKIIEMGKKIEPIDISSCLYSKGKRDKKDQN